VKADRTEYAESTVGLREATAENARGFLAAESRVAVSAPADENARLFLAESDSDAVSVAALVNDRLSCVEPVATLNVAMIVSADTLEFVCVAVCVPVLDTVFCAA
jgi:hypothetical protein